MRSLRYKIDELAAVFQVNKINIGCVTESWLDNNIATEAVDIDGFTCYRCDRLDDRKAGGVVCYVDENWPCVRLQSLEVADLETIWLMVRRPIMPRKISHIAIGVIYHPPDASSGLMTSHIINSIDSILQQHPYAGVMLLGDFNTLNDKSLRAYPLKQLVSEPTRGKATLDKIYTNIADWYQRPITIPNVASSDHCGIVLCPVNQKTTAVDDYAIVAVRSKSSNGKNLLAHALCNVNWNALETIDDFDSKVAYFNNCVIALLDFYLPVHYVKHHSTDKPWITDQFRRLIRQRQYAWTSGD